MARLRRERARRSYRSSFPSLRRSSATIITCFSVATEGVAWWAHIGGFGFGAVFALLARLMLHGPQTRVARWSEMYERNARGRRVPDVRPGEW